MTSFDILESSVEDSSPIEIYTITVGSETYRLTSSSQDIDIGVYTWTSTQIDRDAIGQGSEERKRNLNIKLPSDSPFAQAFINVIPGQRAVINIIRLQRDESPTFNTQALVYKGQIASIRFIEDGNQVQLVSRSIEAATSRTVPRYTFMGMCNHVLYDNSCKVNPAGFTVTGEVTDITGNTITVDGASSQPDGYWRGGFCKPSADSDFRLILDHTGDVLTLLLPFSTDLTGQNVQVFAGCDHTLTGDCATKFDNVIEFGGWPFVPTKNIFATGLD